MANTIRTRDADAMRWLWRGGALLVLAIGWAFILTKNNFHVTPPVVFVALGYFAGVAAVYTLFRTGAAAVAGNPEDDGDESWGRPMGERGELEREKRTLLKAIKEAEFDHQMGKLSKRDADDMIATYRARAIEVIKELDRTDHTAGGGTVRDQIQRELRARLEVEIKPSKKAKPEPAPAKKSAARAKKPARTKPDSPAAKAEAERADAAETATATAEAESAETAETAKPEAEPAEAANVAAAEPADAKEATP